MLINCAKEIKRSNKGMATEAVILMFSLTGYSCCDNDECIDICHIQIFAYHRLNWTDYSTYLYSEY